MTIPEKIYSRILKVFPTLLSMEEGDAMKLKAEGFMPLSLDVLEQSSKKTVIYLAHNSVQNGDLMADPLMKIMLNNEAKTAQSMLYQNDYAGFYQEAIFYDDDDKLKCIPSLMREQNEFLDMWTNNLIEQGFARKEPS